MMVSGKLSLSLGNSRVAPFRVAQDYDSLERLINYLPEAMRLESIYTASAITCIEQNPKGTLKGQRDPQLLRALRAHYFQS